MGLARTATRASSLGQLRVRTEAAGCPSIQDLQEFARQMGLGNYTYTLPARCVEPAPGSSVRGPIETRTASFGKQRSKFALVEIPGRGGYWTLASWVTPGG